MCGKMHSTLVYTALQVVCCCYNVCFFAAGSAHAPDTPSTSGRAADALPAVLATLGEDTIASLVTGAAQLDKSSTPTRLLMHACCSSDVSWLP
jgi:hypothetical protein